MSIKMAYVIIPVLLMLFLIGCSGNSSPVIPGQAEFSSQDENPQSVSDLNLNPNSSAGLLGIYTVQIDTVRLEGSLEPLRNSASQDVLEIVDITNFMSLSPCTDCVKIHSIELTADGHAALNIGIRHPFPAGDILKPPSGKNRLDLHVFNVEGIVVMSTTSADSFPGFGKAIAKSSMMNASGYTDYLSESLNTIFPNLANLHPYKLHFRDYSEGNFSASNANGFADILNPSGYLVMPMGGTEDIQQYIFDTPESDPFNFIFAVGCTYGISAINKAARLNPTYSLPQFNKKAASEVFVEVASNNLLPNNISSSATLNIKVLDMNQGVAAGTGLGEMRAESNVAQISVEVPGVTTSPVVVSSPVPTGGTPRDPANPLTYQITFNNTASGAMGIYRGLVKVTDSYPTGLNESPLLAGSDGITRVGPVANPLDGKFSISEFATYQAFSVEVVGNQPPVVELLASANPVESGCTVEFYPGPGTYDPDGNTLVLFEYDFDYDGVTFDVDASNTTGDPVMTQLVNPGTSNISIDVALRVTDDGDPVMAGMDMLTVTITPYSLGVNFVNNAMELPLGWWFHGTQLDPALCLESDNQICCAVIQWDYAGPGSNNDCKSAVISSNGLTWAFTGSSIGTTARLGPPTPIKNAADKGDTDSYAYFAWGGNPGVGSFISKNALPYEYSWFNLPFDHENEFCGSQATGYMFAFGDSNNRIEVRRGTTQHLVQNAWDLIPVTVTDADPRLSFIRSIDEDSTGDLFLAYYNANQNVIKRIKSNEALGNSWTEGTIWDASSGGFSGVKDPGVDIDENDNIHVSFIRHDDSTNENQICYTVSIDGGATFSEPVIAASSTGTLLSTPVVHTTIGCHSVLALVYEESGDIKLTLSWSGGSQFDQGIIVSATSDPEKNPDLILDSNGDLIFAWERTDSTYNGTVYSRKAEFSQL